MKYLARTSNISIDIDQLIRRRGRRESTQKEERGREREKDREEKKISLKRGEKVEGGNEGEGEA
jgi:hypothetical protein